MVSTIVTALFLFWLLRFLIGVGIVLLVLFISLVVDLFCS